MKTYTTYAALKNYLLVFVIMLISVSVQSQAYIYKFKNPTLTTPAGTAGQVNSVYRFPNVKTGSTNIDALVKIQSKVGNITLQNIDRTADGYDEAFQPEYKIGSSVNAYFEFLITFVLSGTSTPAPQPLVDVSALDIDGSTSGLLTLKEFNRIDMGGGVCTFNLLGSQLTLSKIGTAYDGSNFTGILFGSLVDTAAKEVMFSVSNANVTSFTYRVGANTLLSSSATRYASLYFKKFTYPNGAVLAVSNLASFNGTATTGKTKLTWSLTEDNTASNVVLERSNNGTTFQPMAEFWVNTDGNTQRDFNYNDNKTGEATVYYRLKITGKDGKIQYSNILLFRNQQTEAGTIAIYPSLVQSATTVSFTSREKQNAVIYVTDMSGRTVKKQNILLQEGTNNIQVTGFDQFQKGNYIVSVHTAQEKAARQIAVQ